MTDDSLQVVSRLRDDGAVTGEDPGIDPEICLRAYRTMVRTRKMSERSIKLQRAGRIGFTIPQEGVEATQVGSAAALRPTDWFVPSYRDFGMALYHGVSMVEMMNNMYGNRGDVGSRGRQMPVHFSFKDPIRFVSISSPIGTHIPQAVGIAHAAKMRGSDDVAIVSFGDGGTSSNGFHSGLTFAGVWKAPVVFLCQNNGWAISCPADQQTASSCFAIKGVAYGIPGVQVDGNDFVAVYEVVQQAVERARRGEGPTLIEAVTMRMGGHSSSDDPSKYVPSELLEEWKRRDPIVRFERYLLARGIFGEDDVKRIHAEEDQTVAAAIAEAEAIEPPPIEWVFEDVYEEVPESLRKQARAYYELLQRIGDPAAGDGAFPL